MTTTTANDWTDSDGPVPRHEELVEERLVSWYFLAAIGYLFISMLGGFLMALQLVNCNPLRGIELLSPGRWRMIHTNAVAYGFLANAFLGCLHWAVPRLTLRTGLQPVAVVFHLFRLAGRRAGDGGGHRAGRGAGRGMGRDAGLDRPGRAVGTAARGDQFHGPDRASRTGPLYVTLWYFMAAFVWTFLTYAMGNFMPQYFVTGTAAGAVGGLFIHDLVGLFVTPLGWGLMYYFVPIMLRKPIWSHGLVAGRILGAGVLLSAAGNPPLPVHADSHVPAVRGHRLDDRRRDGGARR